MLRNIRARVLFTLATSFASVGWLLISIAERIVKHAVSSYFDRASVDVSVVSVVDGDDRPTPIDRPEGY